MDNFIAEALRSEATLTPLSSIYEHNTNRLLHAGMGLSTEAGEFLDALKKPLFYGKPLDLINLREELGDIMWYVAVACSALGTTLEAEQERVIRKLRTRYSDEGLFNADEALTRDLEAERKTLEG